MDGALPRRLAWCRGDARMLDCGMWRGVDFPLTWIPSQPGDTHPLVAASRHRGIRGPTHRQRACLRLSRRRNAQTLKPEFASMPQEEIEAAVARERPRRLMEEQAHVVFVHSGDAMPIDPATGRAAPTCWCTTRRSSASPNAASRSTPRPRKRSTLAREAGVKPPRPQSPVDSLRSRHRRCRAPRASSRPADSRASAGCSTKPSSSTTHRTTDLLSSCIVVILPAQEVQRDRGSRAPRAHRRRDRTVHPAARRHPRLTSSRSGARHDRRRRRPRSV